MFKVEYCSMSRQSVS